VTKTAEERLAALLNDRDEEIRMLRDELAEREESLRGARGGWSLPRKVDDEHLVLPVPRLEFVWTPDPDWHRYVIEYRLVIEHLVDGLMIIPLGRTTVQGGSGQSPFDRTDDIGNNLPYRAGAHAHHDAAHLKLPLYAITPDGPVRLDGDPRYQRQAALGAEHRREGGGQ
jgi:hypothetical protein